MNYGVRTGLVNNLVVIDLDGPEARKWWDATGIGDSSAVVHSPREDGGEHHYFRIYDLEVRTITGKAYVKQNPEWHGDVDIRGEGGLVAGPGCLRDDEGSIGTYVGDLSNIPDAPQALLDLLPEKQSFTASTPREIVDRFEGVTATDEEIEAIAAEVKVREASDSELDDIRRIEASLLSLPRKWSTGDGWHDTVFRACCWLWRMVRTPSYAITEPKALEIMLSSTPVWPEWAEDKILDQWESARELTRGQYADPPVEALPAPLDFVDCANRLPQLAPKSQRPFFDVLGDTNARLRNLVEECLHAGLSAHETVSVIHGSAAGESLRTDYGYRKLWREATTVAATVGKASSSSVTAAVPVDELQPSAEIKRPMQVKGKPARASLMSEAERRVAASVDWWGTQYLAWTREIVSAWNGPYHRMNRWSILSLILSPVAVIPLAAGDMHLNLFSFVLGDTTTGKSESLSIMRSVFETYFSDDDDPDIGGDPSPSALGAKLIERDGKPSLFNSDEADGQILKMKQEKSYQTGLQQQLTALYECRVPKMLRSTDKDISGKRATSLFSIHYMGTFKGITEALEPGDWGSGFLHRFIWAIGDESEITREGLTPKLRRAGEGRVVDPRLMQKQWAAFFRQLTMRLAPAGEPVAIEMSDAALERFTTLRMRLIELADDRPELRERLYPASIRMSNSIWKAAALVTLADGRAKIEVKDLLVALLDGEEWFGNVLHMVTATDATKHSRAVAALEDIVLAAGGEMRMEDVYRRSGLSKHGTDTLVTQLIAEGRAERELLADGKRFMLKTIGDV